MAKMNRKGFYPLFTTLGIVLILIVVALSVQWSAESDKAYVAHIDRLSWLRMDQAVGNVKSMVLSSLREPFYDAILEVGRIPEGSDTNPYLDHPYEEGWDMILDDVTESVSSEFDKAMSGLADYSDGSQSTFIFDNGINVTIGAMTPKSLGLIEIGDNEIAAVAKMPMIVTNRYQGWEATAFESNVTIPLNVRLKDMYRRAWEFNQNYKNLADMWFTAAIYARAYAAAYVSKEGPFLKEGHYTLDPIATLLFGDLDTIKEFSGDIGSVMDTGAIPLATWQAEWQYLSEPSFLPAGFDLGGADAETAKAAMGEYGLDSAKEEACKGLAGQDLQDCNMLFDSDELDARVDDIKDLAGDYEDILKDIDSWLNDYGLSKYDDCEFKCENRYHCDENYQDCISSCLSGSLGNSCRKSCKKARNNCNDKVDKCEDEGREDDCRADALEDLFPPDKSLCDTFREDTLDIVDALNKDLEDANDGQCGEVLKDAEDEYVDELDAPPKVDDTFQQNNMTFGFDETDKYCEYSEYSLNDLNSLASSRLAPSSISDSKCLRSSIMGDCDTEDNDCNDDEYCGRCHYPSCPADGASYECLGDFDIGLPDRLDTCRECYTDSKGKRQCKDKKYYIDQCTCRCRPDLDMVRRVYVDLLDLRIYIEKRYIALDKSGDYLGSQKDAIGALNNLAEQADSLSMNPLGYDVFGRIDPVYVKYDQGLNGMECYNDPTFEDRDREVCGDAVESTIAYTVQVAAAALLSGGTLLDYAIKTFPIIFETEVKYNLTETLIDDGNRIILTNVAGEGGGAYTYAPFEFEIYKEKEFTISSMSLGRTFVFVYLGEGLQRMQRVIDALTSDKCDGTECP